jgi:hypothetical protein
VIFATAFGRLAPGPAVSCFAATAGSSRMAISDVGFAMLQTMT